MKSEAAEHADFSIIRYAQCWEDADILIPALSIKEGQTVLSIASAGDNTFSLLAQKPAKIYALDLNPAQNACVEIRKAVYVKLEYKEMLEFLGVRDSSRRIQMYDGLKDLLPSEARIFWDKHLAEIQRGIGHVGKFEHYFEIFRKKAISLVHSEKTINRLLQGGDYNTRVNFYNETWDNLRWKLMFKLFFSRFVMGRLGRAPSFFRYVEGSVADRILSRAKYALTELNPADNPYLYWILKGTYGQVLPFALREENFSTIRENIDKVECRLQSVEDFVETAAERSIHAFNFSDIFEYMSEEEMERIFKLVLKVGNKGARIAYWNMLAPRKCPESLKNQINSLDALAKELFEKDKAFFYSAFRVEEIKI